MTDSEGHWIFMSMPIKRLKCSMQSKNLLTMKLLEKNYHQEKLEIDKCIMKKTWSMYMFVYIYVYKYILV